jgi:IS4 transposase
MRHENSVMHDLVKRIPWHRFDGLVEKHAADRCVRKLSTKSQLVALLHAQLSGATSLREIVTTTASHETRFYHLGTIAPKRSTLADANTLRPAAVFADLFGDLLKQAHRGLRNHAKDAIRLIDSSRVTLNSLSRGWAHYDAICDGMKLHVVYDPDAAVPVHFAVSPARENDMVKAGEMPVEEGATYVFDLGYCSFIWWAKLDAAGCRFVTRLRKNSPTRLIEERTVAKGGNISVDRIVRVRDRLHHTRHNPLAQIDLREVHVLIDTGKTLRLVTNDLTSSAETIADLYKTRWEVELFFRWIKQTLKIRKFLGTSENAVRIQIAVALIAYLLLRMAHAAQSSVGSLLTFARLVRANLMHLRSIHDLDRPPPRRSTDPNQQEFVLC